MKKSVMICREEPNIITLDEWLKYVSESPNLLRTPPVNGINPFTRKPALFHPPLGSVYFERPNGRCTIGYHEGVLLAGVTDSESLQVINQIAARLDAKVTDFPE